MKPRTNSGIPKPKRGSKIPHTKTGIPKPKWGCNSNESPNRFGDPQTKTGIPDSSYQNGDPRTEMGIPEFCSVTNQKQFGVHSNLGTDRTRPQIKWDSKRGPHIGSGIPKPVWVGICQNSNLGSPRTGLGFIPIWGPTYIPTPYVCRLNWKIMSHLKMQ